MTKIALVDLDGTIYKGDEIIEGALEAIDNLKSQGFRVVFCTNNSMMPPYEIANRLNKMGITCCEQDILSSIMMAFFYVKDNNVSNVYICGSDSIIDYFINNGISLHNENECDCLIIAMDDNYNYEKMTRGVRAALHSKTIIVCNEDRVFPTNEGLCPGCGAIASSILFASRKKPDIIVGKPEIYMMDYISKKFGAKPEDMVVIGDGYDSDAVMAKKYGSKYVLIGEDVKTIKETKHWNWSKYLQ